MKKLISTLLGLMLLAAGNLHADIVVLVHGYLGSANSWEISGVNQQLKANGFRRGGAIFATPAGSMLTGAEATSDGRPVYNVTLPSRAPVLVQSDFLQRMLADLAIRHPDEKATLVGHSAGGLVARLTLVRFGAGQVDKLITIATPHLGTGLAAYALDETSDIFPIRFIKDIFAGDIYQTARSSKGLLLDLVPPRPGSMLFWLNQQPHPDISYVSVIRGIDQQRSGDRIIPGFSQDMNNVPTLSGRSERVYLPTGHVLGPQDGALLSQLLNR